MSVLVLVFFGVNNTNQIKLTKQRKNVTFIYMYKQLQGIKTAKRESYPTL